MKQKKSPKKPPKNQLNSVFVRSDPLDLSFGDHVKELRRRVLITAVFILSASVFAYYIQEQLVNILLRPAKNVNFIYTSPGGGIGFLFNVCLYFGIALAIPLIIYQFINFIKPAISYTSNRQIIRYSAVSGLLAALGICFGYFLGLPAAMHFLTHQFTTPRIHPLFTLSEYLSFITFYLLGSALLFQIPLIITLINKNKPIKPIHLFKLERWVILLAFIISAIMAPTINVINQLVLAVPIILMYNLSVVIVWYQNRHIRYKDDKEVLSLIEQDKTSQSKRGRSNPVAYTKKVMENIQNSPKRKRILVKVIE